MALAGTLAAPASATATRIAVVGDIGAASTGSADVARAIDAAAPDAVVLAGDNYYASVGGSGTGRYDASVGRFLCGWMSGAAPGPWCPSGGTAPANRLIAAPGNHDYSDAGITTFLTYFPAAARYGATRIGDIEVFTLDSDEMRRSAVDLAAQGAWLKDALARSAARWQVVVLHHPPYVTSVRGASTALRLAYRDWGADVVISGHDHYYERLQMDGLTYLVSGAGGASLSDFPSPAVNESVTHHAGAYGVLFITGDADGLAATYRTTDGVTRDAVTLARATPGAPEPPVVPLVTPRISPAPAVTLRATSQGVRVALGLRVTGDPGRTRVALTISDRAGRAIVRAVRHLDSPRAGTVTLTLPARIARRLPTPARVRLVLTPSAGTGGQVVDWARLRR